METLNNYQTVCNLNYLKELSNGNAEFVNEMIRLFLAEIPGEIQNLEKGIEEKDYDSIKQSAHKMKSTIPFVGLNFIIGNEVFEIEDLANKKLDLEKIEFLFSGVKEMCTRATNELRA